VFNVAEIEQFNLEPDLPNVESIFKALFTLIREDSLRLSLYDEIIHYGGKRGESLYTHVMTLLYVLYTIYRIVAFESDDEAKTFICAVLLHDLNKIDDSHPVFRDLSQAENVAYWLNELHLEQFFPAWHDYLHDIALIVQSHGSHNSAGGGRLIRSAPRSEQRYTLERHRLAALIYLIRALDGVDLAHELNERTHQDNFLHYLNAYLDESGRTEAYELHRHRLVEQRGLLTNMLHNALMRGLSELVGWQPTLLYADGVVYLVPVGQPLSLPNTAEMLAKFVRHTLDGVQFADADTLLEQTAQGIKFKPDAWISGIEAEPLWTAVNNLVTRRAFKTTDLERKARERAAGTLPKLCTQTPDAANTLEAALNSGAPLISASDDQMRAAELLRTYFIALSSYAPSLANPWLALYQLAELPSDKWAFYDFFDARYDRPYILAGDIALSREEVLARIVTDTPTHLPLKANQASETNDTNETASDDPLWADYLRLYCVIDEQPLQSNENDGWALHTRHYVENNHSQCVQCSSPFPTEPWRAADLRTEELKVQAFSNRLGAGGGEPKKNICAICRIQFLLEKLNYTTVKNEVPLYVHFFPYSFLTPILQTALSAKFRYFKDKADVVSALNVTDLNTVITELTSRHRVRPMVTTQTKAGKPHPYGLYLPQFADSVAGMITLPLNPAGDNDTERYLYALWNALVWGRTFNMKVLLSKNAVPPLPPDTLPSVFLDMVPVAVQGLLPVQEYDYPKGEKDDSTLIDLFDAINALFRLKLLVGDPMGQEDTMLALVRSLNDGALGVFHSADRLMEKSKREFWHGRDALPHLELLAIYVATHTGERKMSRLTEILDEMSKIAWEEHLRGATLKRSPLLYALTEIFDHMDRISPQFDAEAMIAATKRDLFDHLDRISTTGRGRKAQDAIDHFVDLWYSGVVHEVYGGSLTRVLQDERLLKSAYLFYVQCHIPQKPKPDANSAALKTSANS